MDNNYLQQIYKEIEMPEYGNDGKVMLYLNQWPEIEDQFPINSFFLDKTMCGCGATTLFLSDPHPTILCSPRKELMYCKAESGDFPYIHLFKTLKQDKDNTDVRVLQKGVFEYYQKSTICCPFQTYIPKIVVSYDSFKHVVQVLGKDITNSFRIVVDEAQTLFTDAAYRGRQVIEFLENVKDYAHVIYMSATPFTSYMDKVDAFQGLSYLKLIWQPISTHRVNIKRVPYKTSIEGTVKYIIDKYRVNGYFDEPIIVDGHEERSTEAVFYLNAVKKIVGIIQLCGLQPDEVNILCSDQDTNTDILPEGFTIGHAPKRGEKHKTFTFVTRAAFEGVDFNSTCAYSYIFSFLNTKYSNLALDISYDLPQIMGRQRNPDNHFRYSATFFYKTWKFDETMKEAFNDRIQKKLDRTNACFRIYDKVKDDPEELEALAGKYRSSQKQEKYTQDYVDVVDNQGDNELRIVRNDLAYYNEMRAWDIQEEQYLDGCRVMRSIDDTRVKEPDPILDEFYDKFYGSFENKMRWLCEFLHEHPEYEAELFESTLIPYNFKYYYHEFQPDRLDRLSAVSYKEAGIRKLLSSADVPDPRMQDEIVFAFHTGEFYALPNVKSMLQEIYDSYGYPKTAKGNELEYWLGKRCKKTKKLNDEGKRVEGYTIQ